MSDLLRLLALDTGVAVVGALAVALSGLPRTRALAPTIVGLAPATGLAVVGLAVTVGAMVGVDVGLVSGAVLTGVGLLGLGLALRGRTSEVRLAPVAAGRAGRLAELVALALLAGLSLTILRYAVATPLDQWDGWAIWGAKAHALYEGGDIWSPVFTEPEYVMQHQEYPVLLPALEALGAGALGRFDPALIDVQAAAVVVSFGWAAWGLLRLVVYPAVAAVTALALTGFAPLAANAGANYADAVVASFTALGLLGLFLWLTRDGSGSVLLVLAGTFLGAASLTKSEGLLFTLAAVAAAIALARRFGRPLATACRFGLGVLALPALWELVDRLNGAGAAQIVDPAAALDPDYVVGAADRIPTAADAMLTTLVDGWLVAVLAVAVAVAAGVVARAWPAAIFVVLWTALSFGALVLVYFLSTASFAWHLGTSADRVVFSLALGAATLAPELAALAWETRTRSLP